MTVTTWIHDRALTLVLMAMFPLSLAGQFFTGLAEYNSEHAQHSLAAVGTAGYFATGHLWEAIFENWESEFLQMAVFILGFWFESFRTGRASFCRLRRWCGSRSISGSNGRRNQNPCMRRTPTRDGERLE